MDYQLSETDRLLSGMLIAGTIEAVDYQNARVRVRSGDWVSFWLPWGAQAAGQVRHWRPPSVGEQALILSPSGQPEQGMVLPGFYTDQHGQANDNQPHITAQSWPDGAREHYDHEAHEYILTVPAGGRIVLSIGATSLTLRDDGTTLSTPQLLVDAADSTITGTLLVKKLLSYLKGLLGKGGGGAGASIEGNIQINGSISSSGSISAAGSVMDGGGNSNHHSH